MTPARSSLPVYQALPQAATGDRVHQLRAELSHALGQVEPASLAVWGKESAAGFVGAFARRAIGVFKLAGQLGSLAVQEVSGAVEAARSEHFVEHVCTRGTQARKSTAAWIKAASSNAVRITHLLRQNPREVAPELLTVLLVSLVVSGGPDGDGGAPDLDLVFGGIEAHRSVFSHSILMGSALEALLLAVLGLVRLVHGKLPDARDPLWDAIHEQATKITEAASVGVNMGMAYHLFVDGLVQPAAYKDLPLPLPLEGHQALIVANAVAEGIDRRSPHVSQAMPALARPIRSNPGADERKEPTGQSALLEAHKKYLARGFITDSRVEPHLTSQDLHLIRRYGAWFTALEDSVLKPMTRAQMRFVAVARNQLSAETIHERAWHAYRMVQQRLGIH